MTFCRVEAALKEIGLLDKYLGHFKENSVDDEMIDSCSEDVDLTSTLKGVIPIAGPRVKFLKAFRALPVPTMNTAFHRIEAALGKIGVRDEYIKNFEENAFDDETIDSCMDGPDFALNLKDIIPVAGHRTKFLMTFKALPVPALNSTQGQPSGSHSTGFPKVAPSQCVKQGDETQPVQIMDLSSESNEQGDETKPVQIMDLSSESNEQGDETKPVQIMDFKDSIPGAPAEIIFHEGRLTEILNKTKSKKVAVLVIAGPCRKGKSFFLNFVLKYLNSLKTSDKDWMGWTKPRNRLEGFEWKNSTERVTTGIWLWPEPFTMNSENEDFDLLVMDTQGVFDEHTTQREWSILVGLGLLTSSCLIFNTMTDLQEDYLQVFENFLSFGLMAINDQNTQTPFQKLVFLIRDWNVPEQYPYGSGGGNSFITAKLAPKGHHKDAHKRVREQLGYCFENISCFLLPHPGEKILALGFDGNATDSKTFAEEIENCILELLNPSSFPLKKVNGNFLTGHDLLATFRSYCELFNSDEVPSPESVLDITARNCNDVVIRKCIDAFLPDLKAKLMTRPFFPPDHLEGLMTSFSRSSLEEFDNGRKMGSHEMKKEARKKLQQEVENTIEGLEHANAERLKQVVAQAIDTSAQGFEEAMEESLQNGFVPENKVDEIYALAEKGAIQAFTSSCGIAGRKELPKDFDKMCSTLEARMSAFRDKNALAKHRAKETLDQSVRTLVSSYLENVTSQVQDRIVPEEELLRMHELAKSGAVIELQEKDIQEELLQDGIHSLKTSLDKQFEQVKATVGNSNENIRLQAESLVNQVVEEYKNKLKSDLTLDRGKFHGLHEDALNASKATLRSSLKIQDEEFQEKVKKELEDRIKEAYPGLLELVEQEERKLGSLLGQAKEDAAKVYSSSMHNQFPQDDQSPVEIRRLQGAHDEAKSKALESFKEGGENIVKAFAGADVRLLDDLLSELATMIENDFKSVNDSNYYKLVAHAVETSVRRFEKKMEENIQKGFVPEGKLEELYARAKEVASQTFTSSCDIREGKELPMDFDQMCNTLEARMSGFRDKNALAKHQAQADLDQSVRTLVSRCVENVTRQVKDRIVRDEELLQIQELEKNRAICELGKEQIDEQLLQDGIHSLEITIHNEFERLKASVANSNQIIRLQGESFVTNAIREYKAKLKSELTLDREKFHSLHEDALNASKATIRSSLKIQDAEFLDKFQKELEDQIEEAYPELLELVNQEERKLGSLLGQAKEDAAKEYSASMHIQFPQLDQSPVEFHHLQGAHDEAKSKALESLKEGGESIVKAFAGADVRLLDDLLGELEVSIEQAFESTAYANRLRLKKVEAMEAYLKEMKQIIENVAKEDELRKKHENVKVELIRNYKLKMEAMVSSPELLQESLEDLTSSIDEEFKGFLDLFTINLADDVVFIEFALKMARDHYNEEMETHFRAKNWIEDSKLEELHQEISAGVLQKTRKELDVKPRHEEKLQEIMMLLYRKYQERNLLRVSRDSYPIGIDLGTTYSCVAVCIEGKIEVIKCNEKATIPSYVAFNEDHSISVGEAATERAFRQPQSTIFDAKRLIGRKFSDQIVKDDMKLWPFQVVGDNDQPKIQIPGHVAPYRPEQISALVLFQLKTMAEEYLNGKVTSAVVTVPAYFNDSQKQATKDAAEIAGLHAIILSEPTSAAIAYELHKPAELKRNVLIFDLGGGTFDVAVLQTKGGKIDVKAIAGDTHLGGQDFDNEMVRHVIEKVKKKSGIDLARGQDSTDCEVQRATAERLRRIRTACETQKRLLSSATSIEINIPYIDIDGNYSLLETITREEFEDMNKQKFQKCIDITAKAVSDGGMDKTDIDDIVLVGGSTRIPMIRQLLREFFNRKGLDSTMNADEAVARGAAVQAALEFGERDEIPTDIQVSDVCPLSLGIEVQGGGFSVIVPRNTPVPFSRTQNYFTSCDGQTTVPFNVFEGEATMVKNNNLLGNFHITGIPSAPKGQETIDCTMNIDSEGILHVKAVSKSTGGCAAVKIETHKGRMSCDDIAAARASTAVFRW